MPIGLANRELATYFANRHAAKAGGWTSKVADHLLGRLSEGDLLAAAKAPDATLEKGQLCEAWYYSGMKRLFAGDKTGALENFEKCVGTERRDFIEDIFARSELKSPGQ